MDTIVYLLIFLVVITISIYIYNVYKDKTIEYFQATPTTTNNYIESDLFPNLASSTYIEIPCYSTIRGIQNEFVTFITDYRNFRGDRDRYDTSKNYTYTDVGKQVSDIKLDVILLNSEKIIGYKPGDITNRNALLYSGGYITSGTTYVYGLRNQIGYGDTYTGNINLVEVKSATLFERNFNKFKQYVGDNTNYIQGKFFRNTPIYAYNSLKYKLNPTNKNLYNFRENFTKSFWNPTGEYFPITKYELKAEGAPYNIGEFLGEFPQRNTDIDRAALEKLRVYVYGSISAAQNKEFKDSAFYGTLFNFSNVNTIDLYLRISYYSSNLNGIDLQYSHGLFSNDVKPQAYPLYYLYDPDVDRTETTFIQGAIVINSTFIQGAINYNNSVFNNFNINNNTLTFPSSSDPIYIEGNPTSVTRPLGELDVKQQYVGILTPKVVAKMPPMLRRYITSWSYNRTLRILQRRMQDLGNDYNVKFYFLMGLALNNFFYSNNINDIEGANRWKALLEKYGLIDPATSFGPEMVGSIQGHNIGSYHTNSYSTDMGYALVNAYFSGDSGITNQSELGAVTYRINDGYWWLHSVTYLNDTNSINSDINYKYRRIYRFRGAPRPPETSVVTPLSNETINELFTSYLTCIQKLFPDYGTPLNVLDNAVLDSIAQHFYELTNGLYEINYFYDVFRVGSNMLDIRFDKKQRLDNISYVNLRSYYIPQINEYNNLLKIYEDGTWVRSYSNIDDYIVAVSTSKANLDPVLNPIYPIGGKFNYLTLKFALDQNNIVMIDLSNKLDSKINSVKSQTISASGSNVNISSILNTPSDANMVGDISKIQEEYNSTVDAAYELSNLINGIESSVARIFFTLDNSNFNINGIALGINAALSYNKIYNGNIEVSLIGQGNVNYQPTIRYTKNILPVIRCGNIDFMKLTANLYRDTVFTDISNIVLSNIPYDSNQGGIVVDKILGFTQIDSNTCGYTWMETQYNDFTNQPVRRNTVNIRIPYDFDNSEYQNSRLVFSNNPTMMNYSSNPYPFGNLNGWIDKWGFDRELSVQNDIDANNSRITTLNNELSNIQGRSNIIYNFSNTVGWNKYSNVTTFYGGKPMSVDVNVFLINNFSNKTYFEIYDNNQTWFRNNVMAISQTGLALYNIPTTEIVTRVDNYPILSEIRGLRPDYTMRGVTFTNPIYGPIVRINKGNLNNYFKNSDVLYNYTNRSPYSNYQSPYIWGNILEVIDSDDIYRFVENTRTEYWQKTKEISDIQIINTTLRTELDTLPNTVLSMKNSQTTDPIIYNFIINNLVIIPRYLSDIDNKLGDADGACPALRCEDPTVMTQLMEQYNNDSNNSRKILKILNSYTVNPYQCDYKVVTTPSLSNMNQYNTNIQTLQSQVTVLQNQINTLVTQDNQRSNKDILLTDYYSYQGSTYIPALNSIYNNKLMPSNYPINTQLASVLANYTTQSWVKYLIDKYSSRLYINPTNGTVANTFTTNIYYTYYCEELLEPLLSNLPQDYPYPNTNQAYKLPLDLSIDPNFFNIRSNYIQKQNAVYNPQIKVLAKQREILNSNIAEQRRLIDNDKSPIEYKTFEIGVDVRDCAYFYGNVTNNTGYFVRENQQPLIVANNKSNDTGFFYTSAIFNTFMADVSNVVNPLIAGAVKNSSNMYNAILNQRSDTYDALGKLNTITFTNAPSLNSSNISNMLRNNARFMSYIYLTTPQDTYLKSIRGFGITNANTVQLLLDNTNIIRSETEEFIEYDQYSERSVRTVTTMLPNPIFGETRTELLNFKIEVTDNYLDYTPYYLNTESLAYITKDYVLNMSNNMPYVSGSNNIMSNKISLANYSKLLKGSSSNYTNYSWIPESPPIEWFNSNILSKTLSVVGYLPENIESFNFLQNSIEFNIKTTENLPFSKKNFKLTAVFSPEQKTQYYGARNNVINDEVFYTNQMNSILSDYSYIYSEGNIRTSLRNFIGNLYDQNLINIFKTTFNSLNLVSNGTVYSPTIGKIYEAQFDYNQPNTLLYKCSLLYKDNANNYDPTRIPHDMAFNNAKYYKVKFIYSAERRTYLLENYSDITYMYSGTFSTSVFSGYVVTDPSPTVVDMNYYITRLHYRKMRLFPLVPLGTQFDQTNCQLLSIEFYKDNVKISDERLNIDFENTYLDPDQFTNETLFNNLTKIVRGVEWGFLSTNRSDQATHVTTIQYLNNTASIGLQGFGSSIDGFSFVTGQEYNKSIRRWILQGSFDGTNFFNIHSQTSDYNYPNRSMYYRTEKISLNNTIANTTLPQYPINMIIYRTSECPTFDPFSTELMTDLLDTWHSPTPQNVWTLTYNNEDIGFFDRVKSTTILGYMINDSGNSVTYFLKLRYSNSGGTVFYNVYLKNTKLLYPIRNCNNIRFLNANNLFSDILIVSDTTNLEPSLSGYTYDLTGFTLFNTTCTTVDSSSLNNTVLSNMRIKIIERYPEAQNIIIRRYAVGTREVAYIISFIQSPAYPGTIYMPFRVLYLKVNCRLVLIRNIPNLLIINGGLIAYGTEQDAANVYINETNFPGIFSNWISVSSGFVDYDKKYMVTYIKFESRTPFLFENISLYNKDNNKISYKMKNKSINSVVLEVPERIFGYSFITNNSGTSPNSWTVKGSDGKTWEVIHEESYNLEGKKLYQTPIFYLDGTNAAIEQPQSFEKPEVDVEKFVRYYKQKVNSSVNPEFKKYMYSNNVYYFIFDEYDLNNNLVAKDLIVGFEVSGNKVKKAILYEDEDGNYKPFDLRDSKQKEFWNSMIGLALDFQDF